MVPPTSSSVSESTASRDTHRNLQSIQPTAATGGQGYHPGAQGYHPGGQGYHPSAGAHHPSGGGSGGGRSVARRR